jgi:hypothetical protein
MRVVVKTRFKLKQLVVLTANRVACERTGDAPVIAQVVGVRIDVCSTGNEIRYLLTVADNDGPSGDIAVMEDALEPYDDDEEEKETEERGS